LGQRILIVDDEQPIVFALQRFLTSRGFEVASAHARHEAEALILLRDFDAVIAEMRLSEGRGAEGLELISCIRNFAPRTRMVLLTAYGTPEIEREARARGADEYLLKPQPLAEIADLLDELLKRSE
jgi:ActR/RegA family two-component response regulator